MTVIELALPWLANALLLLGAFFALTGALGMIRLPDFFSRLHPAGVTDSLAVSLILLGLMIHAGLTLVSGKLLILMLFLLLTSPTACHALAKAAFLSGMADDAIDELKQKKAGEAIANPRAEEETAKSAAKAGKKATKPKAAKPSTTKPSGGDA